MIANITQGGFLKPLLQYNQRKINKGEASLLAVGNVYKDNIRLAESMIAGCGYNSKRKDKFFHVSLNFTQNDINVLNDDILKNIAKEYLQGIGFEEDHPYIIYKHDDTLHPHIHIVTSKIHADGKCNNKSIDFRNSQEVTRNLEIKYNLTKVSSKKTAQKTIIIEKSAANTNLTDRLNYHIKFALTTYKVQSLKELQDYLNDNNLDFSILSGVNEIEGKNIPYTGVVFNDLTINFKQKQKGIKASSLYLKPTIGNLEKIFVKNKASHKFKKGQIKNILEYTLSRYHKITLEDLKSNLKGKDIIFNYRKDSNDKLVGVSFTDAINGYKYTGEKIGKNYTAQNLANMFGDKTQIKPEIITKAIYSKYKNHIVNSKDKISEIENLIKLGFNVQLNNNNLYISDYKNNSLKDFVLFRKNVDYVEDNIIQLIKNSQNLNFNDLSKIDELRFDYNRAKSDNDLPRMNSIEFKMNNLINEEEKEDKIEQPYLPNNDLDELFKDSIVTQETEDYQDNSISDADKKKSKDNPFRKLRRR